MASATESEDTLDAVITEIGGEQGLNVVAAGRSHDADLEGSDLFGLTKKTQKSMSTLFGTGMTTGERALRGASMGASIGSVMPGVGTAVGGVLGGIAGVVSSDGIADLVAGGSGSELIGKATSAGEMMQIDELIMKAGGDDAKAAEALSSRLNIKVTSDDVKVYRSVIDKKTNTGNAGERLFEGKEGYEKRGAVFTMAREANDHTLTLAAGKATDGMKDMSQRLVGELQASGIEGLDGAGATLASSEGLQGYSKNMRAVIKAAADSGLTMNKLGADASPELQLLAQSSEKVNQVEALAKDGQVNVGALKRALGASPGSGLSDKINNIAGEGVTISEEDANALALSHSGDKFTSIATRGAEGMATAVEAGKTNMEIQTKTVKESAAAMRKNSEMIDAIYSRMSGTAPTNADSAVAGFRVDALSMVRNPGD